MSKMESKNIIAINENKETRFSKGEQLRLLIEAIRNNDLSKVYQFLYDNADVNSLNEYGEPLAVMAINSRDSLEMIELFMRYDVNLNCRNKAGVLFIDLVKNEEHKKIVRNYINRNNNKNGLFSKVWSWIFG